MLKETHNAAATYVFKRRFKNLGKTTEMNNTKGFFEKLFEDESGIHNFGYYCKANITSDNYIFPYHLPTWIQQPKWDVTMKLTTSYRVKSIGFQIDNITCGEWTIKNNEEVSVPNPEPYFDIYVDKG